MSRVWIGLSLVLCMSVSYAGEQAATPVKPAQAAEKISWLKEVGKAYHEAESVEMSVEKSVKQFFKPKAQTSKGKLTVKRENFRLELTGYENSTIVVKDGKVKILNYAPKEAGFKTSVIETSFKKGRAGHAQELFSALLTGKDLDKQFKVEKSEKKAGQIHFELSPQKPDAGLEKVSLVVADKTYRIQEIAMWDEYENETKYLISDITFNKEVDDSIFTEKTPEDALVEKL